VAVNVTVPDRGGRNQVAPSWVSAQLSLQPAGCESGCRLSSMKVGVSRDPPSGVTVIVQVTCVVLGVAWVGETLRSSVKRSGAPAAVGLRAKLDSIRYPMTIDPRRRTDRPACRCAGAGMGIFASVWATGAPA
jgi:hypothetical protein